MSRTDKNRLNDFYSICPACDGWGKSDLNTVCPICNGERYLPVGLHKNQVDMFIARAKELAAARAKIAQLEADYEALDKPLMGDGITNLEILEGVLQEHRNLLDANTRGKVFPVVDPNASYFLLGEMEAMLEELRLARVAYANREATQS